MIINRYKSQRERRKARTRGRAARNGQNRLVVFRSNKYIYAQVVDGETGKTLAGVRSREAKAAGEAIAKQTIELGVKKMSFDRGGYKYHGRVKDLAEAARAGGLKI